MTYQVGKLVFMVPSVRWMGQPRDVAISKVGRVWVSFENDRHRFNKETGRVDGPNGSIGSIYASAADYHEEVKNNKRMHKIQERLARNSYEKITNEQARQIAEILGIKDEDEVSEQ